MSFAEQLKRQLNIVDVVSHYVRLKRSGSSDSYVGLCPFHSEKTPSFRVNGSNQFYKCFGCDAGGDIFTFVMERESVTFPEALQLLAERYGIPMPERKQFDNPEAQRRAALLEMHEIAAEIFQSNLRGASGADVRRYLESRGVSPSATDEFRLGLSDASGQQLSQRLQKFGPALLEASGLVIKRDSGGFYDRFRSRLMFPIHSESGKVIAFGGRALHPNDEPKYLNSPETAIYKKSAVLYNLHRAKIDARKHDRIILVEGYMDVIGIYSAGFREVVASCGTSLATDQVRAMKRQVAQQDSPGHVVLNFDADPAGIRSTEKYIVPLLAEGLRVRVLELPGGVDPDEFIHQNGAGAYEVRLNGADSYFYWLAARAREKFDMRTAEGRLDAFRSLLPAIQHVSDRLERAAIAAELAEVLGVDRDLVREHLRRTVSASQPSRRIDSQTPVIPAVERILLGCLLNSAEARKATRPRLLGQEILEVLEFRRVFEAILAADCEVDGLSLKNLLATLEPDLQRIVTDVSFFEAGVRDDSACEQAEDCVRALEEKAHDAARKRIKEQICALERQGNVAEAMRLTNELNETTSGSSRV